MAFPTISGLTLRLESDLGITKDGSNRVSQWADQAGVYGNYTQGTDALKPVHTANQFGTKSGLLFDGSDDFMANAAAVSGAISASAFEMFVVSRINSSVAAARGIWSTDNGTLGNNVYFGATTNNQLYFANKPSGVQVVVSMASGNILKKAYLHHARHGASQITFMDGYAKSKETTAVSDGGDTSATALAYGTYLGRVSTN